jgi:hypothetical protein
MPSAPRAIHPPVRAPRPVAGLPAIDPTELAKAWLLELIAAEPLEQAAAVRVAEFAREAPVLCAALLAAVADDSALAALAAPPATAGVPEPQATPAVLAARAGALGGADDAAGVLAVVEALRATAGRALRAVTDDATALDANDRLAYVTTRIAQAALATLSHAVAPPEPYEARDQRATDWPHAIARALDRYAQDGETFVLLAGEVVDRERWEAADPEAIERAAAAVTAHLRPGDRLIAEYPGRWWLIAPDTDAATARQLATGLADAAEQAGRAGVAFGLAACPHDGVDAEALVAHADEALFRARAAGLPVD